MLIDPSKSPIRSTPREIRDLIIAASNSWLLVFDNLSHIREWLSDSLCRLSTGGEFSTRALYSNDGEKIFDVQRPVLINGITELSKRSDLLDRTIPICLPTLSAKKHKTERELWDQFNAACPRIFGAVLTAVSTAIRNERNVKLSHPPRMADFAKWVVAAEPALDCVQGDFIAAYRENRKQSSETAIDVAVIGEPILKLIEKYDFFQGTATELLKILNRLESIDIGIRKPKGWPQQPNSLSSQLRRLIPNLRAIGIEVVMDQRDPKTRTKIIRIDRITPKKKKLKVKKRKAITKHAIDR